MVRVREIFYEGVLIEEVADLLSAQEIGMVFQNRKPIVMDTVIQELAFSLENIGLPSHIIQKNSRAY